MYKPPIKGKTIRKEPSNNGRDFAESKFVVDTMYEMRNLRDTVENTLDLKVKEVDSKIEEYTGAFNNTLQEAQNAIVDLANTVVEEIHSLEQIEGKPGKDSDPEEVAEILAKKMPKIDEKKLKQDILASIPKFDEKKFRADILSRIPDRKADLKIIQENIEIDPMSVIEKIMALPEEKRSKLQLGTSNISGLSQTIQSFNSQLSRGYLHGGGISNITGLIQAGTNITITGNGTQTSPYVINSTGGGGCGPFSGITGTPYEVAYFDSSGNGTSDPNFWRDDINFNTGLETPIDTDIKVLLRTDFDGNIFGVPSIFVGYENDDIGLNTGVISGGDVGSESTQIIFLDGNATASHSVEALNVSSVYFDGDITTQVQLTDVGASLTYEKTSIGLTQGLSLGSSIAQVSRIDTNDAVEQGTLQFTTEKIELFLRETGGRRHGAIVIEDDLITIGDPTGQSTDTNIVVDVANGQVELRSGQIVKQRAVSDAITTIGLDDYLVTGEGLSSDRAFTLPAIGSGSGEAISGVIFVIKNKSDSTADIILTPAGADTVDGAASLTIIPGQSYTIVSDGSADWEVI